MAYFLGCFYKNKYKPIQVCDNNGKEIGTGILDVIRFTMSFQTKQKLISYLDERKLIPSANIELYYLIAKGRKNNKEYYPINYRICLESSKNFFDCEYLYYYFKTLVYDEYFVEHLFKFCLDQYGNSRAMLRYLDFLSGETETFFNVLYNLRKKDFSSKTQEVIDKLILLLEKSKNEYQESELDYIDYNAFLDLVQKLICNIEANDSDLINLYYYCKNYLYLVSTPSLKNIELLYSMLRQSIELSNNILYTEDEHLDILGQVTKFLDSFIFIYDKDQKKYKMVGNHKKMQERNFVELAMFAYQYSLYLEEINNLESLQVESKEEEFEEEEEREEFLEESDFESMGTSSCEQGYRLRLPDYLRGTNNNG